MSSSLWLLIVDYQAQVTHLGLVRSSASLQEGELQRHTGAWLLVP
jgi:hypothetical protein